MSNLRSNSCSTSKLTQIEQRKNEAQQRFHNRMIETNRLQYSSKQRINFWDDDQDFLDSITVSQAEIKEMLNKKGLKILKKDILFNEWNNYTNIPKKTAEILACKPVLEKEEKVKIIWENLLKV